MPGSNGDTFQCLPIGEFVERHLAKCEVVVDPFARNCKLGTITNDMNPDTLAEYHMDVLEFLKMLVANKVQADAIIFDPPYSPRQIKELYGGIGKKMTREDGWRTASWKEEKVLCQTLLNLGGVFLYFGWNSQGITHPGYAIREILLVCHGATHSDTICMAQYKMMQQLALF